MDYEFGLTPSRMGLTFNISGVGFGFKMGLGFVLALFWVWRKHWVNDKINGFVLG